MLTGDPHLAEDLAQETMIRVHLTWRRVSGTDRPELYVKRMLTNQYLGWRRGAWFRRTVLRNEISADDRTTSGLVAPDPAEAGAERDEMWLRLAGLPRRQRAAIVLRSYEGLTDSEIADVLNVAVGTIRAHISRALVALRGTLALERAARLAHTRGERR